MNKEDLTIQDTVQLDDGRIGIIDEMNDKGDLLLEVRQQDFHGEWPLIDSNAKHVFKIIHNAE